MKRIGLLLIVLLSISISLVGEVRYYGGASGRFEVSTDVPEEVSRKFLLGFNSEYRYLMVKVTHVNSGKYSKNIVKGSGNSSTLIKLSKGKGNYKILIYGSNSKRSTYHGLCYFNVYNSSSKKFAEIKIMQPDKISFSSKMNGLSEKVMGVVRISGKVKTPFLLIKVVKESNPSLYFKEVIKVHRSGNFSFPSYLKFGSGRYSITIFGSYRRTARANGLAQVKVINSSTKDRRFLAPSLSINSDNEHIIGKSYEIVGESDDDDEKVLRIYKWVTSNIAYDTSRTKRGTALNILDWKKAVCSGYSYLLAALLRAQNIKVKYITGFGRNESHAWNEIFYKGHWIVVDATWDAGGVRNGRFHKKPRLRYFNMKRNLFYTTHRNRKINYR